MAGRARHLPSLAGWLGALAFASLVAALIVVTTGAGAADGPEWFGAGAPDRQAAYSTGGNNSYADIGNAVSGSCVTRFLYDTIRVKVEVTSSSQQGVTVELTNVPGASSVTVAPGTSRVWSLDKGSGHCQFAGPEGTVTVDGQRRTLSTREGWTNQYCSGDCTSLEGTFGGTSFKLKPGEYLDAITYTRVSRPADPATRTAQIDLRFSVEKISPPIRIGGAGG